MNYLLFFNDEIRENTLKSSGKMTINLNSEEENLINFAIKNLKAQDFINMCEVKG